MHSNRRARGERRITGPAGIEPAEKETAQQDDRAGNIQPKRKRVQTRECHIVRADHHRHEIVRHRAHTQQNRSNHHDAVQTHHRVIEAGGEKLHPRLRELGAEDERKGASGNEKQDRGNAVLNADDFVIVIDAEITEPARFTGVRFVMLRCFFAAHPFHPIGQCADAEQKRDKTDHRAKHRRWFAGTIFPRRQSQQHARANDDANADYRSDNLCN